MSNKQIQIAFVSLFILSQLTVVSFARFVFEDVVRYGSEKTPEKFLDSNLPECIKYFTYICLFKIAFLTIKAANLVD
jgi:hypothetical protein